MKNLSIYLSALFILLCMGAVKAQTTITYTSTNELGSSTYDPRVLTYYSVEELNDIKANDPEKFTTIVYYYTQSYLLQIVDCFECNPVDPSKFDISRYEGLRKKSTTVVYDNDKEGFKLILLPVNSLEYKLPFQVAKLPYTLD
jgi:hypothetical protein